jgi:hypothetical protein
MERALYNGVLSGVSLDGKKFFYENPLASIGKHHRQDWFDCACCPPNLARLLASLGEYIYSQNDTTLAVHLYIQGSAAAQIGGEEVTIHQETRYPWEGEVRLSFEMKAPLEFTLALRVPGWCRSIQLQLNHETLAAPVVKGYFHITRGWQPDDVVSLKMDMPVERVYARPEVRQNAGLAALQRGPVVYCLEAADHPTPVEAIYLPKDADFTPRYRGDLLDGVVTLEGRGLAADLTGWGEALYRSAPPAFTPAPILAIPYYAWDNRQPGAMRVWLPII